MYHCHKEHKSSPSLLPTSLFCIYKKYFFLFFSFLRRKVNKKKGGRGYSNIKKMSLLAIKLYPSCSLMPPKERTRSTKLWLPHGHVAQGARQGATERTVATDLFKKSRYGVGRAKGIYVLGPFSIPAYLLWKQSHQTL